MKGERDLFTGFTQEAQEFLWQIGLNNNRTWFEEHKHIYTDQVYRPMQALCLAVGEDMEQRHKLGLGGHCTRIYRDARRLHGRGPYKNHMWFTLRMEGEWTELPVFFFEIAPDFWQYGMGCYRMNPRAMERFRKCADANPARLTGLIEQFNEKKVFSVYGDEYAKPKGERPEPIAQWYNRKELGFIRTEKWNREVLSPKLPQLLTEHFSLLLPLYHYFLEFAAPDGAPGKER